MSEGRLRARLEEVTARGVAEPLEDGEFEALALAVFRHQCREVPAYGALVRSRGIDPAALADWTRIPAVPTRAFREVPLVDGDPDRVEAVFRTSGTTDAAGRRRGGRGVHRVRDLSLYRSALLPNARAHLRLPDEEPDAPIRVLALLPEPSACPDSSLVHMASVLLDAWDDGGGGFLLDAGWEPREEAVDTALERARADRVPVLLVGTAFAFVHLTDRMEAAGRRVLLPDGSRVMETGGFKGRSRAVERGELYRAISAAFGVPEGRIVNEYGMTELLSQFYEPVLRGGCEADPDERHLVGPPWLRTRVLDPTTLAPLPEGGTGLLFHFDLANLHSVSAVLTGDLGTRLPGGFRVHGRAPGAEPRGCSLAVEELLAGAEAGR